MWLKSKNGRKDYLVNFSWATVGLEKPSSYLNERTSIERLYEQPILMSEKLFIYLGTINSFRIGSVAGSSGLEASHDRCSSKTLSVLNL